MIKIITKIAPHQLLYWMVVCDCLPLIIIFMTLIAFSPKPDLSEFSISLTFLAFVLSAVIWRGGVDARHLIENRKRHILKPTFEGFLIGFSLPLFICILYFGHKAFAGDFDYPKDPRLWSRSDLFKAIKDEYIFALVLSIAGTVYGFLVGLFNRAFIKIYRTHLTPVSRRQGVS